MKENNLLRLINAFVLCHFTYTISMHNWLRAERDKLNALIRKVVKRALGLPIRTHTEDLLKLGVHNSAEEIAEAQERAQLTRLSTTAAGKHILEELGYQPTGFPMVTTPIPRCIRDKFEVAPVPRNVHPVHNEGRRKARAAGILKHIKQRDITASFVDAAEYSDGKTFAIVVVDSSGKISNCASIRTSDPGVAEQAAIALALLDGRGSEIYSDSKTAVRAFQKGCIAKQAARLLSSSSRYALTHHSIHWFPAHVGSVEGAPPNLNESAHEAARELTDRASSARSTDSPPPYGHRDAPATHNEIIKFFYMSGRVFPPPHPKLNRAQAVSLRLLQTSTYPCLSVLHEAYPDVYRDDACPSCGQTSTLAHMLWECGSTYSKFIKEEWDSLLRSPALEKRILAVRRARDRAGGLDLPVPTWD
ncbi:uncharacterized protein [Dermacentor andersoni]|uniref:uncharacterized protein n=1 Tax=Dermacentor andersoni TaxID=34620 RepID=UPI003B3AC979